MRRSVRGSLGVVFAASSFLLATCSSDSGGPTVTLILAAFAGGSGQTATVAQAVTTRPAVRLTNSNGDAVAGTSVTFAVASGGGTITGATQTTDANGVATVGSWILGTAVGANTLTGTAAGTGITGNPVTFSATGTAGAASAVAKQAGDGGSSVAGVAVTTRPAVRVTDAHGNPVAGVSVTFAVATGGGTATGTTQPTDANGVATVGSWTLGALVGSNTLTATAAGSGLTGNPATFTVTGIAGAAAILTKTAGDGQTAAVSTALPANPTVRVTDANTNPVAGVVVTFAIASGGGTATGLAQTTNAAGTATVGSWTIGPAAGANTMTATATGAGITGNPATFTATGTALVAANMVKFEGDAQVAIVGQAVPIAPAVRVTTAGGAPVPGVLVDFTVTGGGGVAAVGPSFAAPNLPLAHVIVGTDANGVARVASWTLGATVGANTLQANATGTGIAPVTFTATAGFSPATFAGNWAGTWFSTTFGTGGSVTSTVTVNTVAKTATLNTDFNGAVFGIGDPPPEIYNGSYTGTAGFTFNVQSPRFGNLTFSVSATGAVTGQGLNPAPGISRIDFSGTTTANNFNVNYTVTFTGGGTAVGTWVMSK